MSAIHYNPNDYRFHVKEYISDSEEEEATYSLSKRVVLKNKKIDIEDAIEDTREDSDRLTRITVPELVDIWTEFRGELGRYGIGCDMKVSHFIDMCMKENSEKIYTPTPA